MKFQPLKACQICLLHYQEIPPAQPKKIHNPMHPKTLFTYLFFTVLFVLVFSAVVLAQPGLPESPDQAPIDGGLGLLAAAGGAYALKKLRDRKKSMENEQDFPAIV